jgi:hypothetical protein
LANLRLSHNDCVNTKAGLGPLSFDSIDHRL